ncbi:MAG: Low conductance mechanosensitive channel YnaI [Syntrophaceae bacterium PtaU1.Bin231]|nr:MAG: Low conductance mechanosensitive channel YnaI [Syntrophaceae bacterium PtaU1.Bin231]
MKSLRVLVAVLFSACLATGALAAQKTTVAPAAKQPAPAESSYDDPLGRSTPQGAFVGFLKAMERENDERAVEYLDTRQTGRRAEQLAAELHRVLDQGLSAAATKLSARPEGNLNDGLPVNREVVGVVKTKKGSYDILLDRVQKEGNPPIWLFSAETLKLVPQIYEEIDIPWIERHLPAALTENRLAGWQLYLWFLPVVMLPAAFLIGWLAMALFLAAVREPLRRRFDDTALAAFKRTRKPLMLIFTAAAIYILSLGSASLLGRLFWTLLASTMAVAGLAWAFIHVIEIGAGVIERRQPTATHGVIRLTATLLKALVVILGLTVVLYYFAGINVTAVVAGLGVGGLAVAFAAQKTIENFFGGVFLVWDKPVRVGDYCKAGEHQGTVEYIGLRSTQIRTLNRTMVFIPNGQLASVSVENFTLRDRFLFRHMLNLRYETGPDQLRYLLAQLRELLYRHPRVDSATARVRLVSFGPSSLDVEVFAYIDETVYDRFLAVQEDLMFAIMETVEQAGSGFAFPSQSLYVIEDKGIDGAKGREAAETVQQWRKEGELPFPDHAPERVARIENTLPYPPEGSAGGNKESV